MANQTLCLKWDGFQDQERASFQELRNDTDFTDVTLACEDQNIKAHKVILSACSPVLKIQFGPPNADFWSVWSSQKTRKFRQIQPTTKVRILCFEWKRICFQTRDMLCSYNMNYEE